MPCCASAGKIAQHAQHAVSATEAPSSTAAAEGHDGAGPAADGAARQVAVHAAGAAGAAEPQGSMLVGNGDALLPAAGEGGAMSSMGFYKYTLARCEPLRLAHGWPAMCNDSGH